MTKSPAPLYAQGNAMDTLQAACVELKRRARRALVVTYDIGDECDVRLHVAADDRPWVVEVLGPYEHLALLERWHAVQIDDDVRHLWRGPARQCRPSQLIGFIEDLLCELGEAPGGRCQRV